MNSVDWLWIGVTISCLHRGVHVRLSHLVYRTGKTIYSAEHLHETKEQDY